MKIKVTILVSLLTLSIAKAQVAVDLGLSVKWASCNLGASSTEESGDYYRWSEIRAGLTSDSIWDNLPKTNSICGLPKYDAATAKLGKNWRLPTVKELEELVRQCKWNLTKQKNVIGYKITGPSGNSIFLPTLKSYSQGIYWSGERLNKKSGFAYELFFTEDTVLVDRTPTATNIDGNYGIRPVTSSNKVTEAKTLTIRTTPNANIIIDGEWKGLTEVSLTIPSGVYNIESTLKGCKPDAKQITFTAKGNETVELKPQPAFGSISINTNIEGATLKVNNEDYGKTPSLLSPIPIGKYKIMLSKNGYLEYADSVSVQENDTTIANIAMQKISTASKTKPDGSIVFNLNGTEFTMIPVKGGGFRMDDSQKVKLSDYYIGQNEVTVALFSQFVKETKYRTIAETNNMDNICRYNYNGQRVNYYNANGHKWRYDEANWYCNARGKRYTESEYNHPVTQVSWNDCQEFMRWLSNRTGKKFRLPTNAEWEFAAKGGLKKAGPTIKGFIMEESTDSYNYKEKKPLIKVSALPDMNSSCITYPVASFEPNELGLYDCAGNVSEWCSDYFPERDVPKSNNDIVIDPKGPKEGDEHIYRGLNWDNEPQEYDKERQWDDNNYSRRFKPNEFQPYLGFRLAMETDTINIAKDNTKNVTAISANKTDINSNDNSDIRELKKMISDYNTYDGTFKIENGMELDYNDKLNNVTMKYNAGNKAIPPMQMSEEARKQWAGNLIKYPREYMIISKKMMCLIIKIHATLCQKAYNKENKVINDMKIITKSDYK